MDCHVAEAWAVAILAEDDPDFPMGFDFSREECERPWTNPCRGELGLWIVWGAHYPFHPRMTWRCSDHLPELRVSPFDESYLSNHDHESCMLIVRIVAAFQQAKSGYPSSAWDDAYPTNLEVKRHGIVDDIAVAADWTFEIAQLMDRALGLDNPPHRPSKH